MDTRTDEYQKIYTDYRPKIVRYLRRIVGDVDAEDVAQEVFMKVHEALAGFRGDAKLSTWIYRIATNTAVDRLRSSSSKIKSASISVSEEADTVDEVERIADERVPRLDILLIRKDMNDCIRGIVDSLPENYRTVLVLSDLEGLTNAEIVEVLDLSQETVKIRLHRARRQLRKELEKACHFYLDDRNELSCDRRTTPLKFRKK